MEKRIVRIPSRLYFELFSIGGDKLLSVFSTLKFYSQESRYNVYKSKNNKKTSGYGLLRAKTNISLSVLEKYVPQLIELDLCKFDDAGNFIMKGAGRLKKAYGYKIIAGEKVYDQDVKMIPLVVGDSFVKTSYNMTYVRLHSLKQKQEEQIAKKKQLCELKSQGPITSSVKVYRAYRKALQKGRFDNLVVNSDTVLSNQGYAKIKDGSLNKKSKGNYWKKVLVKHSIVKSFRNYRRLKKMSYSEYRIFKKLSEFNPLLVYSQGYLCLSLISSFCMGALLD